MVCIIFFFLLFLEFHTTIDAIEDKKLIIGQTPFEVTAKDVNVKYMTVKMPEGHSPTVFEAVMRMPKDLKLTFRRPIFARNSCSPVEKICGSINGREIG